ncbi:alpha/beta fold hydrolase [Paracoccus sp. Z330]|uniref:Alpha/beta fold hydrolase n=1 Tax=Paracoccus onchidii TaxID=3017813 RepID=A0ABT4ZAB1_9RHOB|nr:alpha/beta fold hydrolase [Paracoccus onchidii]MDB6176290.1 alpha/beta fold hydrolase [Paracoccus onchidii]
MKSLKLEFPGHDGGQLATRLDLPEGTISGYALLAHCFTCSKDLMAVRRIAAGLARHGIALMRFDFTGLGASEGEFSSTNFSSNIEDLKRAAKYLADHFAPPCLLIGHSLGGAAVLAAAADIPGVEAVATIGAPADVAHVLHNFRSDLERIRADGQAEVSLQGRKFTIERQFIDDACNARMSDHIGKLHTPLLIMHAPRDATVGIENAAQIFEAAKHPKSFVSLDGADHLLTRPEDAEFVANVIAGWASRYLRPRPHMQATGEEGAVLVTETRSGKFQQSISAGGHHLLADEPKSYGGDETGPSPYDFVAIGLGACTSMTLRMWAERKGLTLGKTAKIDRFERHITVEGRVTADLEADILRIADLCPVHKTLESSSVIVTHIRDRMDPDNDQGTNDTPSKP